jgi:hypothetical protein
MAFLEALRQAGLVELDHDQERGRAAPKRGVA